MGRNSWVLGVLIVFGLTAQSSQTGFGQVPLPPPPGPAAGPGPGVNLEQVSRRMAEAVRELGEDIATSIGQSPGGQNLLRDVQELQRATGEWYATVRGTNNPFQLRQSYSGIDISWHRLQGQLAAPGFAPQPVIEEVRRVERADAAIHQALNLNNYPTTFEGAAAPTGPDETQRLAYALAQAGDALAPTLQATYGADPRAAPLINDAAEIARMVDAFYDNLNNPAGIPGNVVQQAFLQIVDKSTSFGISLATFPMPPPVKSAWDNYTTPHNLLRDHLGLNNVTISTPPPQNALIAIPVNPNPTAQIGQWAEGLDRQVDELLANYAPTVAVVPEGREILGDMERLRNDVRNFRGDVSQGLNPGRLAFEFREVDADWQRLARRVNRITRGRNGPNIQRVQQIGQTCEQIHRALGMPGYPPVIRP